MPSKDDALRHRIRWPLKVDQNPGVLLPANDSRPPYGHAARASQGLRPVGFPTKEIIAYLPEIVYAFGKNFL